jgi:hypothetical protein
MVVLDVSGRRVEVTIDDAQRLQEAAVSEAGRSSVARDLSLLLERALAGGRTVALRRGEARALARVAEGLGLSELSLACRRLPQRAAV